MDVIVATDEGSNLLMPWRGAPGGIRTPDTRLRKPVLYPLSY